MGGQGSPAAKYTLTASRSNFTLSQTVVITVAGGDFTGHLIGASSGEFASGSRSSSCDTKTVSHTSTSLIADGTTFEWTPSSCEDVNFKGMFHDNTAQQMYITETITVGCESSSTRVFMSLFCIVVSAMLSLFSLI